MHPSRRQRSMSATKDLSIVCSNMRMPTGHLQTGKYNHIPEDIEKEYREFDYAQIAEILEKTGTVRHILPLNTGSGYSFQNI